uniref:NADH deshydrogenase subunit 6 n=1 Tax=Trixagus sp. TRI01 TaxID=1205587 RepID=A0A0S2MQB2_9COLE|nr:NADH deshydrogenase subunit 6 [Trixagus sp. TRI01]
MTIISSLFLLITHPVSMGLTLLIQISIIAMNLKLYNSNSWFSYILFIIMVGGLMIIFIYMTSISSNLKFVISNKKIILLIFLVPSILVTNNYENKNNEPLKLFLKFIYSNENFVIITMISYMFIVLIAVSNLTKIKQGPIRKI